MRILFVFSLLLLVLKAQPVNSDLVAPSADQICPILTGEKIPSVKLKNINGELVNLLDLVSQKPTVMIFYRGGWCPYCTTHLSELHNIEKALIDLGYQIVAVSIDKPEKLAEAQKDYKFKYILLSDNEAKASAAFGLAFRVDDETVTRYKEYDIDLEASSGRDHHILPVPAAFVLDTEGTVRFSYVNPNYKIRIDKDLLLAAAKSALKE